MIEYYPEIKLAHMACAWLSISGFLLRGFWRWQDSPLAQHRLTRTLPHGVDTVLLGTAIAMASLSGQWPFAEPWLTAKLLALLVYIALGMVAFRFGRSNAVRTLAFAGALLTFAYLLSVATFRSPMPWS